MTTLPKDLRKAIQSIQFSAVFHMGPRLLHCELGWPGSMLQRHTDIDLTTLTILGLDELRGSGWLALSRTIQGRDNRLIKRILWGEGMLEVELERTLPAQSENRTGGQEHAVICRKRVSYSTSLTFLPKPKGNAR